MKKKIHKYDFLIIGGGLIGSIAAVALQQKNFKVLVVEKNSNFLTIERSQLMLIQKIFL
jgi:flavin-dependent dehydrogenase